MKDEKTPEPAASDLNAIVSDRCATCAHWGKDRNYATDSGQRLKSCSCPKFAYGSGYHDPVDSVPNDGASIEDDEGWGMLTGPDFGCIHWAANAKVSSGC